MTPRLIARDGQLRVVVRAVQPNPRSCGGCTACCSALRIDELDKPEGVPCAHSRTGRGCATYASRPEPCREFQCLWLRGLHGTLPEHRPDRIGVVLVPTESPRVIEAREVRAGASESVDAMFLIHTLREAGLTVRVVPPAQARTTPLTIGGRTGQPASVRS